MERRPRSWNDVATARPKKCCSLHVHEPPLTTQLSTNNPHQTITSKSYCWSQVAGKNRKSRIFLILNYRALAGFLQKVLSGAFMKTVIIFPIHYTLISQVYYNTIWTDEKMTFRICSHSLFEIIMWFGKLLPSSHISAGIKTHLQISQWKAGPILC